MAKKNKVVTETVADEVVVVEEEVVEVKKTKKGRKSKVEPVESEPDAPASDEEQPVESEPEAPATEEEEEVDKKKTGKRHVRSPVERIDLILSMLSTIKVNKTVLTELQQLRKALDGAKVKPEKRTRAPNAYNLFIKDEMVKVRAEYPEMTSSEQFSECIKRWRGREV